MPYNNTKVNFTFLRRLKRLNIEDVDYLLQNGLEPFSTVNQRHELAGPRDGGPAHLFMHALFVSDEEAIIKILNYTVKTGRLFDFSQACPNHDPDNSMPMNALQYAAKYCAPDIITLICDYQEKHFPEGVKANKPISDILNRKFNEKDQTGKYALTTLAISLIQNISIHNLIFARGSCTIDSDDDLNMRSLINEWLFLAPYESRSPATSSRASIHQLRRMKLKLKIGAPTKVLMLLTERYGLNLDSQIDRGMSAAEFLIALGRAKRSRESWGKISKLLKYESNRIFGLISIDSDVPHAIQSANVTNLFFSDELTVTFIPDYSPWPRIAGNNVQSIQRVNSAHILRKIERKLSSHDEKIEKLETAVSEVKEDVEEVKSTLEDLLREFKSLSDIQHNDTIRLLDPYPFHAYIYKVLHHDIESYIRQVSDRKLNVFKANPSSDLLRAATAAASILGFTANCCPVPYASLVNIGLQAFLGIGIQLDNRRKSNAASDATLDINSNQYGTFIGRRLTAEAMETYGLDPIESIAEKNGAIAKDIFMSVKIVIDKMHSATFVNPAHILAFLSEPALRRLRDIAKTTPRKVSLLQPNVQANTTSTLFLGATSTPTPIVGPLPNHLGFDLQDEEYITESNQHKQPAPAMITTKRPNYAPVTINPTDNPLAMPKRRINAETANIQELSQPQHRNAMPVTTTSKQHLSSHTTRSVVSAGTTGNSTKSVPTLTPLNAQYQSMQQPIVRFQPKPPAIARTSQFLSQTSTSIVSTRTQVTQNSDSTRRPINRTGSDKNKAPAISTSSSSTLHSYRDRSQRIRESSSSDSSLNTAGAVISSRDYPIRRNANQASNRQHSEAKTTKKAGPSCNLM